MKYFGAIFHDFRRTGALNLVRAGVLESVAMRITGHKTRSVFELYNITSERDLDEAARKVERYIGDLSQRLVKESAKRERAEVKASTVVQ